MKFDHLAIKVNSVDESIIWYQNRFNAKVLKHYSDWGLILINELTLALIGSDKHPEHIAFCVDDIEQFPCQESEIKKHRDGSYFFYEEGPNNEIIEWIYWPKSQ